MEKILLSRWLASAGVGSRRFCDKAIEDERISVNGAVTTEALTRVETGTDVICFDGKEVTPADKLYYYLLNKPRGYLCSHRTFKNEDLAVNLITSPAKRIFSAGRLDKESEGLLIFTNDGAFCHYLEHPDHGVEKTYMVTVYGPKPSRELMDHVEEGIIHRNELLKPLSVNYHGEAAYGKHVLKFCLNEGKNREIRRICRYMNLRVRKLQRITIGSVELGDLEPGEFRILSQEEVDTLWNKTV